MEVDFLVPIVIVKDAEACEAYSSCLWASLTRLYYTGRHLSLSVECGLLSLQTALCGHLSALCSRHLHAFVCCRSFWLAALITLTS